MKVIKYILIVMVCGCGVFADVESEFEQVAKKYKGNPGFVGFMSKLKASEFLANKMVGQLDKASNASMLGMMGGNKKKSTLDIAPAKDFYAGAERIFAKAVKIEELSEDEKKVLGEYYSFKLSEMSNRIAKAGQGLAIAEPEFKGMYDYVLVLPLLHCGERSAVNMDYLPGWMNKREQLMEFSDSCLLHFGKVYQAMELAKKGSEAVGEEFNVIGYYRGAAKKCGAKRASVAVDCLERAIELCGEDSKAKVELGFEVVGMWNKSGNYGLAAGAAKKISEQYPQSEEWGKAVWSYYHYLSMDNKAKVILSDIDEAIKDERCGGYEDKLLYIKWWALRRERDKTGRLAALEYEMIKKLRNDEMVAPVLLSQATDMMAEQRYNEAIAAMDSLMEKFPKSNAAKQALKMKEKLGVIRR